MPRRSRNRARSKRRSRSQKYRNRRTRRQRGGTLAFLEPHTTTLAVGLRENPEGEYDNPDNMPLLRATPL
jgi:hypothetical protein